MEGQRDLTKQLLHSPCVFCGYSEWGFFEAGTHHESCPWHKVAGGRKRRKMLRDGLLREMARVYVGAQP